MPNLRKIAEALNAYPWTTGQLTNSIESAQSYCAVGALLRYAGVPRDRMADIGSNAEQLDSAYGFVLQTEYGISGADTLREIMAANDTAGSRGAAAGRVLGLLSGVVEPNTFAPGASRSEMGLPPAA